MREFKIGEVYRVKDRHNDFKAELLSPNHPTNPNSCAIRNIEDNKLSWVGKDCLKELPKDTPHLKGLFGELKLEIVRAVGCKDYYGIVFVHPDDLEETITYTQHFLDTRVDNRVKWNHLSQQSKFTFQDGGVLKIDVLEKGDLPQHDYTGCAFTSILVQGECFGKYVGSEFVPVNEKAFREGGNQNFIMYMLTRLRSESKFPVRFVYTMDGRITWR